MKRKITGAILISLSVGLFWQALAQTPGPCEQACIDRYRACVKRIDDTCGGHFINPCGRQEVVARLACKNSFNSCRGNCVH